MKHTGSLANPRVSAFPKSEQQGIIFDDAARGDHQ
jgi:hypothetical protein